MATEPETKRQRTEKEDSEEEEEEEEYDEPLPKAEVVKDLYLDTIDRHMLDFDFEKLCSVSLSNLNVYACLVCGKYYQGRGKKSHAYTHSLAKDHHVFINLQNLKVYILPEDYEVDDPSLNDIKYVLNPTQTPEQVAKLDTLEHANDLNNKQYLPGFMGLNNVKASDYVNVVIQALVHIPPIRDYFILEDFDAQPGRSELVKRFGALARKMWNPKAFKGQVSPHELLQAVSTASNKRFSLIEQSNAVDFLTWFLNSLHDDLGGTKKRNSSIVHRTFQGKVHVETQVIDSKDSVRSRNDLLFFDEDRDIKRANRPFLFLALDLPPAPLYQDELDKNIIPQVALSTILKKYDGSRIQESASQKMRYHITKLPNYLIFHIKRFNRNNWGVEKNPTIVTFPITNLDMSDFTNDPDVKTIGAQYDLLANISHEGKADPGQGIYKVHVRHRGTNQWYQIQDLMVEEIMPQMISLSESYIQVWERKPKGVAMDTA